MGKTKKNKVRTIDGKAIYLSPGLYEANELIPNPHLTMGHWPKGIRFIVERHIDKIGDQNAYEHFSIRLADSKKYLVKSYQSEKWNPIASKLRAMTDDLDVHQGEILPLSILDQLTQGM